jgi:hypothetical protein
MAKRKTVEDMEISAIKEHLSRQDKMHTEARERNEAFYRMISEINTMLGGSASMGVPGIRQDVKVLKDDVEKLKKSDSMRGKWLINLNSIPGAIITLLMIIGSVLGIISTYKTLTKVEPTPKPQTEQRTP